MCTTMEGMMQKHTCSTKTTTSPTLSMHRDSHMISKVKPKIRIIHIFAPEIIKTDVANFRELVQRLTGKPTEKKKLPRMKLRKEEPIRAFSTTVVANKMEMRERIKGEEEIWGGANSGGGFLGGFTDMDGFMQELNHGFPLMPLDAANSHMDSYGERLNLSTYS